MLKFTDKRGNTIYAYQHPEKLNIYIDFGQHSGCTVYLARQACSRTYSRITFWGDDAAVFVGDSVLGDVDMWISHGACCYIGNGARMVTGGRGQKFRVKGGKIVVLGNDCLMSDNIEITTTDGHRIYDQKSLSWVSVNKSVCIGDHVWMGRNTSILKGTRMASGSMVGIGSMLTGKWMPPHSVNAGVPGRVLSTDKFWSPAGTLHSDVVTATPEEACQGIFDEQSSDVIRPCDLEYTLQSLAASEKKIAFLYDVLYRNARHNRFAWSQEAANATDAGLLPYGESFARHLEDEKVRVLPWRMLPLLTREQNVSVDLMALWHCRHRIRCKYWRFSLLSRVTRGRKREKYKEKKRRYKELLACIRRMKTRWNELLQ